MRCFKLLCFEIVALALAGFTTSEKDEVFVYQLDAEHKPISTSSVDESTALAYLSDRFDISEFYSLGDNFNEKAAFISQEWRLMGCRSSKPKMAVLIDGVEEPETFVESHGSFFKVNSGLHHISHKIFGNFPKQMVATNTKDWAFDALTQELKAVSLKALGSSLLDHFNLFKKMVPLFGDKLKDFRSDFISEDSQEEILFSKDQSLDLSTFKLINDMSFINEVSQLVHLSKANVSSDTSLFFKSHSLTSMQRFFGTHSDTYLYAKKALSNFLVQMQNKYDITIVTSKGNMDKPAPRISKRQNDMAGILETGTSMSKSGLVDSCFSSRERCESQTSKCNKHGTCEEINKDCFSCVCSSSFNKKISKTTRWSGVDCSKKDISAEANLLLFTVLGLVALFVGGIKLLIDVGNEPLAGILDASTGPKT